MKWFRFYPEALNDPKVQQLPPSLFKFWINILCLASDNNGALPDLKRIAYATRMRPHRCQSGVTALQERGLLDATPGGLVPHNWSSRQYKSDDSAPRVRRYRNAAVTPAVTPPDNRVQSTETESSDPSDRPPKAAWPDSLFKSASNDKAIAAIIDYWREQGHEVDKAERGMIAKVVTKHGTGLAVVAVVEQAWKKAGPAKFLTEVLNAKKSQATGGKRVATNADAAEAQARF